MAGAVAESGGDDDNVQQSCPSVSYVPGEGGGGVQKSCLSAGEEGDGAAVQKSCLSVSFTDDRPQQSAMSMSFVAGSRRAPRRQSSQQSLMSGISASGGGGAGTHKPQTGPAMGLHGENGPYRWVRVWEGGRGDRGQ